MCQTCRKLSHKYTCELGTWVIVTCGHEKIAPFPPTPERCEACENCGGACSFPAGVGDHANGGEEVPKVSEVYAGNYLSAAICDQRGLWGRKLEIAEVREEQIRDRKKLVLRFSGVDLQLPLNKTNAMVLAQNFGDDTAGWIGKTVQLVKTMRVFQGKPMDAIAVVV